MRDLTVRLDALDPEAGAALRVIAYFDDLVAHGAGLPAIVRGASILAACPAALVDPARHVRVRIGVGGVAGAPGPRDPGWPWTAVGPDGELWLERDDEPRPIDAMVLERAAAAIGSVDRRARGRAAHGRADADARILLDPASSAPARSAAAQRLHLSPTVQVRAVATASGMRIEPAGDPVPAAGRAGIGPAGSPDELPGSAAAARLALRLTARTARPRTRARRLCTPGTLAGCWSWHRRSVRKPPSTPTWSSWSNWPANTRGCWRH